MDSIQAGVTAATDGEATREERSSLSRGTRARRAVGVAMVWALGYLPVALGSARCPMAEILGTPCPGCGMTRAMTLLWHGDVMGSLRMHPLAVPSAFASLFVMAATVAITAADGTPLRLFQRRIGRVALATFVAIQVALVGVWLARMLGALGGPVPV